jgi:hypothetical protein
LKHCFGVLIAVGCVNLDFGVFEEEFGVFRPLDFFHDPRLTASAPWISARTDSTAKAIRMLRGFFVICCWFSFLVVFLGFVLFFT